VLGSYVFLIAATARMDRLTFFHVYWGRLHPRQAVLSGKVRASPFAFMDLYKFGHSFDCTSEKWAECKSAMVYVSLSTTFLT